VHIQNLTSDALWLQRMKFESAEGWDVSDVNLSKDLVVSGETNIVFAGSTALLQPQDTRQYIYILSPKILPSFPVTHTPGSIIALGRLDISWRSSFGEPGRLLTSVRESLLVFILMMFNSFYRCFHDGFH
jgi:trafficking protein particle complex subunit 13